MSRKQLTIASTLVAALFAGSSFASEGEQFNRLDANSDGAISMEEAAVDQQLNQAWGTVDANQDGKVERAEFSAFEEQVKPMSE